jgi:hypothetical protein
MHNPDCQGQDPIRSLGTNVYQVRSNPPGNEVILLKAVVYPFWIECAAAIVCLEIMEPAERGMNILWG